MQGFHIGSVMCLGKKHVSNFVMYDNTFSILPNERMDYFLNNKLINYLTKNKVESCVYELLNQDFFM